MWRESCRCSWRSSLLRDAYRHQMHHLCREARTTSRWQIDLAPRRVRILRRPPFSGVSACPSTPRPVRDACQLDVYIDKQAVIWDVTTCCVDRDAEAVLFRTRMGQVLSW